MYHGIQKLVHVHQMKVDSFLFHGSRYSWIHSFDFSFKEQSRMVFPGRNHIIFYQMDSGSTNEATKLNDHIFCVLLQFVFGISSLLCPCFCFILFRIALRRFVCWLCNSQQTDIIMKLWSRYSVLTAWCRQCVICSRKLYFSRRTSAQVHIAIHIEYSFLFNFLF